MKHTVSLNSDLKGNPSVISPIEPYYQASFLNAVVTERVSSRT